MKSPDSKLDAYMRAYASRWIKSLEKPRPTITLGYFFVGLFILFWSSSLTTLLGYDVRKGWGALVFVGIGLLLTLPTILFVQLLAFVGLDGPTRSAFMFSAVIGPYVNMIAEHDWNLPTISHILGFFASILAFLLCLLFDRLIDRSTHKPDEVRH